MKYEEYIKHIGGDNYLIEWSKKQSKHFDKATTEEVEHILDYLVQSGKKLERMSYKQAKELADKWTKSLQKKGKGIIETDEDTELVHDFGDGFKIVKLVGENAYKREGFLMSHCVADYYGKDVVIYSLRDKDNMPHCTMEKDQQVKGKGNGDIHPKYIGYVVTFLEKIGMTVGDSEMKHLGYANVEKIVDEFSDETKKLLYTDKYFPKDKRDKILDKNGNKITHIGLLSCFDLIEEKDNSLKVSFDIPLLVSSSIEWISSNVKKVVKNETIKSGGNYSQLAGGDDSQLAGGNYSQLAGGDDSQLAGGNYSKLAGGDDSQLAGGYNSKLAGGDNCIIIGDKGSIAKGGLRTVITLVTRNSKYEIESFKSEMVDGKRIKADTFYKLEDGEFVEVN